VLQARKREQRLLNMLAIEERDTAELGFKPASGSRAFANDAKNS